MMQFEILKVKFRKNLKLFRQNKRRLGFVMLSILLCMAFLIPVIVQAEETQSIKLKVKAKLLNGRSAPRKNASKEAFFDFGDILDATGEWSKDHKWVEVYGGESGTVWVSIRYVTERTDRFKVKNVNYNKVKVRKWPENGKVMHYIYKGQSVYVNQVVLGWGKTKYGWVDLSYMEGD